MTSDADKLKSYLITHMYKKAEWTSFSNMFYSAPKNLNELIKNSSVGVRYKVMLEKLISYPQTFAEFAVTYNDQEKLRLLVKDFTSDQMYAIVTSAVSYQKNMTLVEYLVHILSVPNQFLQVTVTNIEEMSKFLLANIKPPQKMQLLITNHLCFGLVKAESASVLESLLEGLTDEQVCNVLQAKDQEGKIVLEAVVSLANVAVFNVFKRRIYKQSWPDMLTLKCAAGTPFQQAVDNQLAELLKLMLDGLSDEISLRILSTSTREAASILYSVPFTSKLSWETVVESLLYGVSSNIKAMLLKIQDSDGNTMLHLAAFRESRAMLHFLLAGLTSTQCFEILAYSNVKELTVLHIIVQLPDPIWLVECRTLLSRVEKVDQLKLVAKRWKNATLVHLAVKVASPELIEYMLEGLSAQERFNLVRLQDDQGMTALHCAASLEQYSSTILKAILNELEGVKHELLLIRCNKFNTPLHYAAKCGKVDSAVFMLSNLTQDQLFEIAKCYDNQRRTMLHIAAADQKLFDSLLSMLSLENQLLLLNLPDETGAKPLEAAMNIDLWTKANRDITPPGIDAFLTAYRATANETGKGKLLKTKRCLN